ncbi:hypothetical protein Tco_0154773 [Tanacetum coccineum]
MLPKSNQTIYDAPDGFVGLYTHSFTLENLRLPLPKFFCYVLKERKRARDIECEELRLKCKATMAEFDKNLAVNGGGGLRGGTLCCHRVGTQWRDGYASQKAHVLRHLLWEMRCFRGGREYKGTLRSGKVKGYRPTYKKEYTKASNDLTTATFPFLSEVIANHSTSVEALLSKKPKSLRRPTPTKTHAPAPSAPS